MQRRALLAAYLASLTGIAGCLDTRNIDPSANSTDKDEQTTDSSADSSVEDEQNTDSSADSVFNITNERDSEIEASIRLKMGQNAQADDVFSITNESDSELDVSTRLKDGERSFAIGGFTIDKEATKRFEARFVDGGLDMSIAVKILSPQKKTYEKEVPVGVPVYDIIIQSDGIKVTWAEV